MDPIPTPVMEECVKAIEKKGAKSTRNWTDNL